MDINKTLNEMENRMLDPKLVSAILMEEREKQENRGYYICKYARTLFWGTGMVLGFSEE